MWPVIGMGDALWLDGRINFSRRRKIRNQRTEKDGRNYT